MGNKGVDYVVGADFGSDSVRVVILDAATGEVAGQGVSPYARWSKGLYCESAKNSFRQHPDDYTESLVAAFSLAATEADSSCAGSARERIRAICVDTTGSTPALADERGVPLALLPEFSSVPDAMFILWKDHTALAEAAEINALCASWGGVNYLKYSGGVYSSEWFWAKLLHVIRTNLAVASRARTAVEHCDWIVALLTGTCDPAVIKRSRCAAGHKCLWHREWGGYPERAFLSALNPKLADIADSLGRETYTTDEVAGSLCPEWQARLGLSAEVLVCVGAYDAHVGAVGGGVAPGVLVKSVGTSTCDVIVGPAPKAGLGERLIRGICGQVDGSVLPGLMGYEAGQSAYGDYYAWFRNLLMWPLKRPGADQSSAEAIAKTLLRDLEAAAADIPPGATGIVALDWINGRRTPYANQGLTAAVSGLTLGTDAPSFLRALIEATAYGARAIIECFESQGISIETVNAIGGVARKSPLSMQILADVTGRPIHVTANDQSCAIGAAVFAATAAGIYPDVTSAGKALAAGIGRIYQPDPKAHDTYNKLYERYTRLGNFIEGELA